MTVDLYRNEGQDCTRCHGRDGTSYENARLPPRSNRASSPPGSNDRRSSAGAVSTLRIETDCLLGSLACGPSPLLGVGGARAIGRGGYGRGGVEEASSSLSTRERNGKAVGSGAKSTRNRNGQERRDGGRRAVSSGKEFLLRYHHHVTFRRLTQPVMDTHTVQMPLSLSATCLDACGAMVAVGTREGPVILFHVGPVESPPAAAETPPPRRGGNPRDSSGSSRVHSGSVGGEIGSDDSSGIEDRATVVRAYGSFSKGEGPISAIVLDRAKIVAAGRESRKMDSLFVVRIYAVDSSRLLRSLRCIEEVSRLCLFDPVLAVHCWPSGNLLFRDVYADSEDVLGPWDLVRRRFAPLADIVPGRFLDDLDMAAFAPGEVQQPVMGGDGVLLHCTSSSGYMYEMLMSGVVRNFARDPASPEDGDGGAEMARGWHVCADSKAKLVNPTMMARAEFLLRCRLPVTVKIRVTPRGIVSGWHLHQDGRRARGLIFSFGTDFYSADIPTGICRSRYVKSVSLAAGGMILATARHGAAPCLWDVRLTRRRKTERMPVKLEMPVTGVPAGGRASSAGVKVDRGWTWGIALYDAKKVSMDVVTSLAQGDGAERPPAGEGHERGENKRPHCVKVKPWPARALALGLIVDAGRGRMVSVGSDGRLRITRLRPNNREQRLRTALLLSRRPCKTGPVL